MALPLLSEQIQTAFKAEGTYGTAELLSTTEAITNCFDTDIKPDGSINQRKGQSALSPLAGVPGSISNRTTLKTELYGGPSADPPAQAVLYQACGMALSTATLTPQTGSASATSITIGKYLDGTRQTSAGCMGNFVMKGESGKPVITEWDFMGTYIAPTDTALIAPTYDTTIPPVFMGATLTIGGTAYPIQDFELSPNNQVVMRPVGNSSTFGYLGACIVSRRWTFKCTVEMSLLATKDWYGLYVAGTTSALSLVVGAATHNIMTMAAPKMQLNKAPGPEDRNGYAVMALEFDLIRNAAAGDDEFSLIFS